MPKINTNYFDQLNLLFIGSVNLLYLYKYGSRQTQVDVFVLIFGYILLISLGMYWFRKVNIEKPHFKTIYWGFVIFVSALLLAVNLWVDKQSIHVDRWSAMEVGIKALINGDYPYTALDHLQGRTSNFPALILMGLPFYLLGDVGFLQVGCFVLFAYMSYQINSTAKKQMLPLLILLASPCYWWEIFVKSDLMSNLIICLCFIALWQKKNSADFFKRPILLAFICACLVMTRAIVLIPLSLFLFKSFTESKIKTQWLFSITFIITTALLIGLVLMNCPDIETLKKYNPLELQSRSLPWFVSLFCILLPLYFSFRIKKFQKEFYQYSGIFILIPALLSFTHELSVSIENTIINSSFDLSYLAMAMPFLAMTLTHHKWINNNA